MTISREFNKKTGVRTYTAKCNKCGKKVTTSGKGITGHDIDVKIRSLGWQWVKGADQRCPDHRMAAPAPKAPKAKKAVKAGKKAAKPAKKEPMAAALVISE